MTMVHMVQVDALKELMHKCFQNGMDTQYEHLSEAMTATSCAAWWHSDGKALLQQHVGGDAVAREEHAATLEDIQDGVRSFNRRYEALRVVAVDIHRMVEANHAGIAHMLEALQPFEPDEVLDDMGPVYTVNAEAQDGTSLVYTVQCLSLSEATAAAAQAWGRGGWETLRKRHVTTDE